MEVPQSTLRYVKLETDSGLTDITLTVYDVNNVLVSSQNMQETITGIYRAGLLLNDLGNYTATIASATISKIEYLNIHVVPPSSAGQAITKANSDQLKIKLKNNSIKAKLSENNSTIRVQ